ncbi:1,3-beta-glucanosyltransferase GAS2 [Smittium culicis]|uniref:1,3-beta-glucanosyltransferase n=1 Tax=Smittium culicis TaxID=133412 RepID=A0A1R1YSI7_9FUNG|nr:1,3-beta-glucanosyltransferase GAS2 [Smittium culicis]
MISRSLLFFLSLGLTAAIDPLQFVSSKIVNLKTSENFIIKGVAYQPKQGAPAGTLDPLADEVGCLRDVEVFKDLGINAIRVYEVDPSKNHDICMKALSDADIYVMLDLSTPEISIPRVNPYWDTYLLDQYKLKADAFSAYDNILAFVAGNNVTIGTTTVPASAFVKASIRDVKTYLKSKNVTIPVGYSGNIDFATSFYSKRYFECGSDPLAMVDFYAFSMRDTNIDNYTYRYYWDLMNKNSYLSYTANFISEYGNNNGVSSDFNYVDFIYKNLTNYYSGGFLFEYSNEGNGNGLVDVNYGNSSVIKMPQYDIFKKKINQDFSSFIPSFSTSAIKPDVIFCECASKYWAINSSLPPPPSTDLCSCLSDTFTCQLPPTFNLNDPDQSKILNEKMLELCKSVNCTDIMGDPLKNQYGKYSGCTPVQKANYVLSLNFSKNNNTDQSCSIDRLNQPLVINSTALNISTCQSIAENYLSKYPAGIIDDGASGKSKCAAVSTGNNKYPSNISHIFILAAFISLISLTL